MEKNIVLSRVFSLKEAAFFLRTGIWRVRKSDVGILKWIVIRALRIVLLTLRGFVIYAAVSTAFWRYRQYHIRYPKEGKEEAHREMMILADEVQGAG